MSSISVDEERESFQIKKSKSSASGSCLAFARFMANFTLALLIKVLLIKTHAILKLPASKALNSFFRTNRDC